jgi:hypothetical protein
MHTRTRGVHGTNFDRRLLGRIFPVIAGRGEYERVVAQFGHAHTPMAIPFAVGDTGVIEWWITGTHKFYARSHASPTHRHIK